MLTPQHLARIRARLAAPKDLVDPTVIVGEYAAHIGALLDHIDALDRLRFAEDRERHQSAGVLHAKGA